MLEEGFMFGVGFVAGAFLMLAALSLVIGLAYLIAGALQRDANPIVPPLPQPDSKPKSRPRLVYGKPQD